MMQFFWLYEFVNCLHMKIHLWTMVVSLGASARIYTCGRVLAAACSCSRERAAALPVLRTSSQQFVTYVPYARASCSTASCPATCRGQSPAAASRPASSWRAACLPAPASSRCADDGWGQRLFFGACMCWAVHVQEAV